MDRPSRAPSRSVPLHLPVRPSSTAVLRFAETSHAVRRSRFPRIPRSSLLTLLLVSLAGCLGDRRIELPSDTLLERGQLRIFHDFDLPEEHRLVAELVALRNDLYGPLGLAGSDEPIRVYLFEDEAKFRAYVAEHYPEFPVRRAFFLRSDTVLRVFAYWGEQVGDDLRHETTHAYLHAVVPQIPLWLDEGLAELHELPRGTDGFQSEHVRLLARRRLEGSWVPDLDRLEQLRSSGDMAQVDYAEAWLWTHFLLTGPESRREWLARRFAVGRATGRFEPLGEELASSEGDLREAIESHLQGLISRLEVDSPPR